MRRQTERALAEAAVALLLIDARAGITPLDRHFANWLRRFETPAILSANKAEGGAGEAGLYEAFSLGLGEPLAISAEHGEGMADLYQALLPYAGEEVLPEAASDDIADDGEDTYRGPLQLAIVGRPNVGKSTLVTLGRASGRERGCEYVSISVVAV